ncbi:MAG: 4Fe-4S dicluster domain-containing protein [Bacteroidales bacterium]|nr:4Fe-4S dicluster domain-containing protein [Bacteroidales bacterium]MDY0086644.1 4Fe-4S dicluster domain-containing protein [Bacteroidales bacterium]HOI31187.1 4Fe-4S dicluster domain-containing protein [Bacteroidales bacterium]
MTAQILFALSLLITLAVFAFTMRRIFFNFRFTRKKKLTNYPARIRETVKVAIAQQKIFRHPVMGLVHALVFWGFIVILFGSLEMVVDGLFGTVRSFAVLGWFYDLLMLTGDVFAAIIAVAILIFLFRRIFLHVKRFYGREMKPVSKADANLALSFILLLMLSLLGMNTFYLLEMHNAGQDFEGVFPVSQSLADLFAGMSDKQIIFWHHFNWWFHILLIFVFANVLPYSKHFHVFMSVPNVFVSRIEPLGKVDNMENITKEVKLMLDPAAPMDVAADETVEKFGVSDTTDINWVNYMNALSCTECGRCTAVCPANITGKLLSPRKIVMDVRARMKEKGAGLMKQGAAFEDGKSLLGDYITEEELWACTMCNACAQECPININQPSLILDMRRYLVLEQSKAPSGLNTAFTNIENNGAPWQYSPEDRLNWAEELYMNKA